MDSYGTLSIGSLHKMAAGIQKTWGLCVVPVLFAVLLSSCSGSKSPSATFVQIPDVHLFDEGKPRQANTAPDHTLWQDDERAFDWALSEIKKIEGLRFVVFTGDLGLEMTGPYWESAAVNYFAAKLSGLPVDYILFVPGNNDLLNEEPKDIGRYQSFVAELAKKTKQKVVDLSRASLSIDGMILHGLNSATFKNAISCKVDFNPPPKSVPAGWTVVAFHASSLQSLWCKNEDIADRLKQQSEEMNRLAHEVQDEPEKVHLIFTHIPPLPDPNSAPGEPLPWNLDPATLAVWTNDVKPKVRCVFAAHFHAAEQQRYGIGGVLRGDCNGGEIVVAPALAVKFQDKKKSPVRGFLKGTVAQNGTVHYEIVSYP